MMIDWNLIIMTIVIGFSILAGLEFLQIIYHNIRDSNEEERRKKALTIYNKRELEFIHDEKKWDKWKEQNQNICNVVMKESYY